ncbi:MAG: hypothetical protein BGO09_06940 [Bacteroidetes bacterium 47-18]|nr:MAG: hypothetical protein BGO09_06940 [Bacteroidetes bacterium 47-18]
MFMKQLFTSLILLLMVGLTANAQTVADVSVEITSPPANTRFQLGDDITISYTLKNNGPDPIDLLTDTLTSIGIYTSLDSTFFNQQHVIVPQDSFLLGVDEEMTFHTRTRRIRDMFDVYRVPYEPGDPSMTFRDNVTGGIYVIFVKSMGFGSGNVSSNWVEADDYDDPADSNNSSYVVIEIDPVNISEINGCTYSLKLYPNPACAGTLNFDFEFKGKEKATVRITDITGKTVLVNEIVGYGMETLPMDVSALNAGLYVLEVSTKDRRSISKFTVGNP